MRRMNVNSKHLCRFDYKTCSLLVQTLAKITFRNIRAGNFDFEKSRWKMTTTSVTGGALLFSPDFEKQIGVEANTGLGVYKVRIIGH